MEEIVASPYKLKFWPTPQDYNEAVQNPRANLSDPALQAGAAAEDSLGIPKPITGGFASVYRFYCGDQNWAVRCFLHNMPDSAERYQLIADFVKHDSLPYTVDFDYQPDGIKVNGQWFPLLKMQWVQGLTLDQHVAANVSNSAEMVTLAAQFKDMCLGLLGAGIAHGDLQHGNIIVFDGQLRLVDYDGMYVPRMQGWKSNELGHRNYQHPGRTAEHFGPDLDNFSSWLIYLSLEALAIDPSLLHQLNGGEDCLLLRQSDLVDPQRSKAFALFENHPSQQIQQFGRFLRWQLEKPADQVTLFGKFPPSIPEVKPLINLPDWVDDAEELTGDEIIQSDESTRVRMPHPQSPRKQSVQPVQPAQPVRNQGHTFPYWLIEQDNASTSSGSVQFYEAVDDLRKSISSRSPGRLQQPTQNQAAPPQTVSIPPELAANSIRKVETRPYALYNVWFKQILLLVVGGYFCSPLKLEMPHSLSDALGLTLTLFSNAFWFVFFEALIWHRALMEHALVEHGIPVVAKVVQKSHVEDVYKITYEFDAVIDGQSTPIMTTERVTPDQYQWWQEEDELIALYDPTKPKHCCIYDLAKYRAV